MKSFINIYESISSAGDTDELMHLAYAKQSAIEIDNGYMDGIPVGLGKIKGEGFFSFLEKVVQQVLDKSNLEDFKDTLLVVGSSVGGMAESESHYFKDKNYTNIDPARHTIDVIAMHLNQKFAFCGTRSFSTACTSSANALLLAKRLIEVGAYKNILVVGADALCYTTVCGFYSLGVLSSKASTPFDKNRDGMNVAEAIGAILIQDTQTSDSIELLGVGASSDAYHMTNPDPQARGAMKAMQNALDDAGLSPSDIDYINAHGTGTIANDKVEALAIEKLFGDVVVNSTKAIIGHTLGAAAAMEAIISCEVLKKQTIPPQTALKVQENEHLNLSTKEIKKDISYVMSNSFAFGGNNVSIIFGRAKS